jgi:hydrogenase maturation protease
VTARTLIAGVGNVFLGDDGFGVETARHLIDAGGLPESVTVADFGVRALHLAYELLDGYEALVLLDAVPRDEPPGTVYLIEPDTLPPAGAPTLDAHTMTPEVVLGSLAALGGRLARVHVVGCQPADLRPGIGLSPPVRAAVPTAAALARHLLDPQPDPRNGTAPWHDACSNSRP